MARRVAAALGVAMLGILLVPVGTGAQEAAPTPTVVLEVNEDGGSEEVWQIAALIGTLGGALGGTYLGHHLSQGAAERREAKQRCSVRALLRLEIDRNLADLKDLWSEVIENPSGRYENLGERSEKRGYLFIDRPMPKWSRLMWTSHAGALADALSPEEIGEVYRHQANLTALADYHAHLSRVGEADRMRPQEESRDFRGMPFPLARQNFLPSAIKSAWPEIERLADDTLTLGNPIKPK